MKDKLIRYIVPTFIIIIIVGSSIFLAKEYDKVDSCYAKNGVLALESWNCSINEMVDLNGEWRFYPNMLKKDLKPETPSKYKVVPHWWESDPDLMFSPFGFATYQLEIRGLKPYALYGLHIADEVTSYTLFANGKKVISNGKVSEKREAYTPQWHSATGVFQADKNGIVQLVLEISNFDYYRGGFWNSPKIGSVGAILAYIHIAKIRETFLFTSIFIMAVINLGLFFIYRKDKTTLYFSLFCFSICLRTLLIGQRIIADITSIFNWYILVRLEYLFGYLLLPLFGLFVIHLFESSPYSKILKRFWEIFIFFCFIVSLTFPNRIYSAFMEPYKWGGFLLSSYFIYLIYSACRKGQTGSRLMLFAVVGMMISILKEIFIGGLVSWVPFASLNFIICFSLITFQRFINVIKKNEVLETRIILDPLTELYNRTYLMELDKKYFSQMDNHNKYMMFLDLDHFKDINDNFGHKIGDFILQETGRRLKNILCDTSIICRYGGDEFIIIVDSEAYSDAVNVAEKIIETIGQPYEKDGISYKIGVSIGIAESNISITNIEVLIKYSDEAMYIAKKKGGNQYFLHSKDLSETVNNFM